MSRTDVAVATGFVFAAVVEAILVHRATPGLLGFSLGGAPVLAVLAVRRTHPAAPVCVIGAFAALGMTAQVALWPEANDSGGGVWLFALMVACYSLGSHGRGRIVVLGALLPLLVVIAADLPTTSGWQLVSGVLFVTGFVGVLPTAVGRLVRVRRDRLDDLRRQHDRIIRELRAERESAALAERLRTTELLQPALLDGMRALARSAAAGADPALIETTARDLLTRTREEVVALTAPADIGTPTRPPAVDHVRALRLAAQPWAVIAAGAFAAGLAVESTGTLPLMTSGWLAVAASIVVGLPLALVWWQPLPALAASWCAAAAFSHMVAPLDGTLSETSFALSAAFAVGALTKRRTAVAGLVLCWLGQVGVGAGDPFGEASILGVCWLGGLAVKEVSRLVEQSHANHDLLAGQETAARQRAVVDERLRLARELHDQIGHSLTVVALQAGAARRLAAREPDRIRTLLETIASAARDGVEALDATQGASDLTELLDRTRAAGLTLDDDTADLAMLDDIRRGVVVRVVQESLTNVLRHAPGASAAVVVRREDRDVVVAVANSAPARPGDGPGTGRGLAGIRERVIAHGGRVSWGARPGGGFEVHAVLPVPALRDVAQGGAR